VLPELWSGTRKTAGRGRHFTSRVTVEKQVARRTDTHETLTQITHLLLQISLLIVHECSLIFLAQKTLLTDLIRPVSLFQSRLALKEEALKRWYPGSPHGRSDNTKTSCSVGLISRSTARAKMFQSGVGQSYLAAGHSYTTDSAKRDKGPLKHNIFDVLTWCVSKGCTADPSGRAA
jgi:hypothetical protein